MRNALGLEVARGFYTILKTRQYIRAAEAAVKSLEGSLAVARKRLEGGSLLKSGALDIEVRLAQAREELVRARNANALSLRALRNLLGIERGDFDIANSAPSATAPDSGDFSGRPELAAARHRERAAEQQVRAAKGELPPARERLRQRRTTIMAGTMNTGAAASPAARCSSGTFGTEKLTRAKVAEANAEPRFHPRRRAQARH